jgi:hypothetical protein
MVRVGVKIPQDGNRSNKYGHVAVVHEYVWRTLCSVCATGARVASPCPATRNLSFLRCFTGTVTLLFQLVIFTGIQVVRVGMKIPQDGNRAKLHGHVLMVHRHVWRTLCSVCGLVRVGLN